MGALQKVIALVNPIRPALRLLFLAPCILEEGEIPPKDLNHECSANAVQKGPPPGLVPIYSRILNPFRCRTVFHDFGRQRRLLPLPPPSIVGVESRLE